MGNQSSLDVGGAKEDNDTLDTGNHNHDTPLDGSSRSEKCQNVGDGATLLRVKPAEPTADDDDDDASLPTTIPESQQPVTSILVDSEDVSRPMTCTSSSTSSECYRLPMFRRKSDPLAIFNSPNRSETNDEEKYQIMATSSCFPKTPPIHKSSLSSRSSALSFQTCKDGTLSDEEDDDRHGGIGGERTSATAAVHAGTTSSILGCVDTPLHNKSSSWSNLMGFVVDDPSEPYSYTEEELTMSNGDQPTSASDLQSFDKKYWIVTTAALPWMTGTAVNPLLRAAYLSQRNRRLFEESSENYNYDNAHPTVTLVLPWLEVSDDRVALYGSDWEAATPERQEAYIRQWLSESAQLPLEASLESNGIVIQWYPARYHKSLSSIFALGDLCELIPPNTNNMICILEEPEHVNCYRAPGRESWRDKFPHVIGIVHTNYKAYAQNHYSGLLTGPIVGALMGLMVRAYCDKVIKLSPVLQSYAPYKEVVCNVHGIRHEFFTVPHYKQQRHDDSPTPKRVYFIGKLLWAKGLDKMMELEACYRKATGSYFGVDIYGSGPQEAEIQKSFLGQDFGFSKGGGGHASSDEKKDEQDVTNTVHNDNVAQRYWRRFRQPIPARFLGRQDHAQVGQSGQYQIFLNPSITEVLCTTTAEAVAMGFWVIVPKHASNEFFLTFTNCLQYSNRREFVEILRYCQRHDPPGWCSGEDRSSENCYGSLSWEAATDRLIETAYLSHRDAKRSQRLQPRDRSIQDWHYTLGRGTGGDVLRKVLGGGPVADQSRYVSVGSSSSSSSSSSSVPASPTSPDINRNETADEHDGSSDSERATKMIQAMMEAIGDSVEEHYLETDDDLSLLVPITLEQGSLYR